MAFKKEIMHHLFDFTSKSEFLKDLTEKKVHIR